MLKKILFVFLFSLWGSFSVSAYFQDIDTTHPYYYAIQYLQQQEIIEGYPYEEGVVFRPVQQVLRSEALKMLYLSAGKESVPPRDQIFPDVAVSDWFAPYVSSAFYDEIVEGFPDGMFHPEYTVTRAEFLKMLFLTFKAPVRDLTSGEEWYQRFFDAAWQWNIIDKSVIDPQQKLMRGEIAEYLYRMRLISLDGFKAPYAFTGFGSASYYAENLAGNGTSSGEKYNPDDLTAAHRTLPFGTYIRVSTPDRSVIVRINDRGPFHHTRVLDLSRRAFEQLAPLSSGVIDVKFQIVSGPEESAVLIPEEIKSQLTEQSFESSAPQIIQEVLTPIADGRSVLFEETVPHLAMSFFPTAQLRDPIPQIIPLGTVKSIAGRVHEYGHKKVVIFLQKKRATASDTEQTQLHFEGTLSGRNFTVPVAFLESGTYLLGLIFDDQTQSRVGEIEVRPLTRKRWFSAQYDTVFTTIPDFGVLPEKREIKISWDGETQKVLTRLDFTQGQYTKTVFVEDGQTTLVLPFSFFDVFNSYQPMTVQFFQALAGNSTLETQLSNWNELLQQTYTLIPGFPDIEKEDIAVFDFPRYVPSDQSSLRLRGRKINPTLRLYDTAYLQTPDGLVREVPLVFLDMDRFELTVPLQGVGPHIIQIVSEERETFFKRSVYVRDEAVLPIKDWPNTPLENDSVTGILQWINDVRFFYDLPAVGGSSDLAKVAQSYAEHLAENDFIAHTDLMGKTFKTRLEEQGFYGEFGENLSMADTLENALWGLENSMAHRKNILTRKWTHVGLGMAQGKEGIYVVQIFSR